MPVKKIQVHVSGNNNKDGVLNVRVQPWRVRLDPGDVVEWELETNGPAQNDILWFRVEQIDQNHTWPFGTTADAKPPHPAYTAIAPNGKVVTPQRNNDNPLKTVISYGLTISFKDDDKKQRIMWIDPDMVIDT